MAEKKWFRHVWPDVVPIQYKRVRVTSAEILLLYDTPKVLIAAPGAGKYIEFISSTVFLDYGSATYAAGGVLVVQQTTGGANISGTIAAASLVNASADACALLPSLAAAGRVLVANDSIELTNESAVHTTGTGVLYVETAYRIHDFN